MKNTLKWMKLFVILLLTWGVTALAIQAKPKAKAKTKSKEKIEAKAEEKNVGEAEVRDVTLRHIKPRKDRDVVKRVRYFKSRLPVEVRDRNNFGWAKANIKGLRKKEYYAHSRIQDLSKLSWRARRKISGISPKPPQETARFETLFVDFKGNIGGPNAIPRYYDTEYKIIEDIAARLSTNTAATGDILLYTDLIPCLSCRGVMRQFLAIYTNIEIEVLYDWP